MLVLDFDFDFQLRFYTSLDPKQVILETFFPANLLVTTEETKPNITKAIIHLDQKILQHKITQMRFACLV